MINARIRRFIFSFHLLLFFLFTSSAQVGINTDTPDASAALDVVSADKGLLIPRVDTSAVSNPATGLMVFRPADNGFYFYNGSRWQLLGSVVQSVIADADGDTKIQVEKNPDEDIIRMDLQGQEKITINSEAVGSTRIEFPNNQENIALGSGSLISNTTGNRNAGVGINTLRNNSTGNQNVALGAGASFHGTGSSNIAIGDSALYGSEFTVGSNNIAIGSGNMKDNWQGSYNTSIGHNALSSNQFGHGNVAIGFNAGKNAFGSNQLYIENTDAGPTDALIYGEFDNNKLRFNGQVGINSLYSNIGFTIQNPSNTHSKILEAISSTGTVRMTLYEDGRFGYNGSFPSIGFTIRNPTPAPPKIVEAISSNGTARMTVYEDGRVYVPDRVVIGTSTPANGYALSVDGKIMSEEVRVLLSSSWPDYVFNQNYSLKPLPELEESIKKNGHLPGIPKAAEIESNGLDLGEINRLQMEKIEELTLYIIQLEKRLSRLESAHK